MTNVMRDMKTNNQQEVPILHMSSGTVDRLVIELNSLQSQKKGVARSLFPV
jgi:hypothetical protein